MSSFHKRGGSRRSGFSLLEVLVVVSIILVLCVIAIPTMVTVIANVRLRSGATSLSGLLQSGRMLAVRNNRTMTAHFATTSVGPAAFIKDATDGSTMARTDPQVQLGANLVKVTVLTGPGAPTALTSTQLGFTPSTSDPSFNSRGLPCVYASGICTSSGFLYYFEDGRSVGSHGWAAVSISPAGRIRKWFWNGTAWGE